MDTTDRYIGKLLDDRYEILERIGSGGMALVYKAFCHRLSRYVAVKIMRDELANDEEFKRRFYAESHAIAMLSHPNIVAVYDVSHSDFAEYIVMELVDGITLKQYMEKRGAIKWKEAVHFTKQIAKALSHAHSRGVVHRDIKPQNIMLLKDGTIKVGDFGIAALENEIQENKGQAIGSIHYIAPEQARGEKPDARSDLYSLGVVMYEMLSGQKPYTGDTIGEIAIKHMSEDPVPLDQIVPDIPPELVRITMKAMSSQIEDRYQSADDMLADLNKFTNAQLRLKEKKEFENPDVVPVRSVSEMPKEKFVRRQRRAGTVAFMSGTFAALLVIIGLFAFLWKFWLGEIFSPAERIALPSFVGSNYEELANNVDLASTYNFKVTYIIDTDTESGCVLSQNPDPGRSMMLTPDGIEVELTVSTGVVLTAVPDVFNMDYREAMLELQRAGFEVDVENATSDSVTKDFVVSTSPAANEKISAGSRVYMVVSSGPEISYISMPNFIGLTEDAAIAKLENAGLSYGGSERVSSEYDAGTVIGQNVSAFTEVEEHTKVFLRVSSGPMGY
ncbi:MAG: Stk1 family PASTA domain-containing Ser/Thr kinase [Candidatus Limivicinus sp.]|jgi:serine/threonine protein kinase